MPFLEHRTSTATSGQESRRGTVENAAGSIVITSDDAFVTRRGDHLGLTLAMRRATLLWWLPQGTELWAGILTQLPDRTGAGGVEASASGYGRVAVSRWLLRNDGASARRTNAAPIYFPTMAAPVTAAGWGLWSTETEGTLRFFDYIRTSGPARNPTAVVIPTGDRFGFGTGINGIGLVL